MYSLTAKGQSAARNHIHHPFLSFTHANTMSAPTWSINAARSDADAVWSANIQLWLGKTAESWYFASWKVRKFGIRFFWATAFGDRKGAPRVAPMQSGLPGFPGDCVSNYPNERDPLRRIPHLAHAYLCLNCVPACRAVSYLGIACADGFH